MGVTEGGPSAFVGQRKFFMLHADELMLSADDLSLRLSERCSLISFYPRCRSHKHDFPHICRRKPFDAKPPAYICSDL